MQNMMLSSTACLQLSCKGETEFLPCSFTLISYGTKQFLPNPYQYDSPSRKNKVKSRNKMQQPWESLLTAINCIISFLCRPILISLLCSEQTAIFSSQFYSLPLKCLSQAALHRADRKSTEALLADGLIKIFCWRPVLVETKVLSRHQIS